MIDPFTYWSRVLDSWRVVGATGDMMMRTANASQEMITACKGIMQEAAGSPLTADYAELSRMVPEKVVAFSAAGGIMMSALLKMQADGLAQMSRAMSASLKAPTPFSVAEFWSGLGLDMLRNTEQGARLGRDTLAPIHRAATANARRLGKRRRAA